MIILYGLILLFLTLYSYSLIDPNLTFIQTKWWEIFRDNAVYLGYYRRDLSWLIFLFFIISLFIFHYFFIRRYKNFHPISIAFIVASVTVLSYPFLSHDFFNYMFDARIATFYQQNPYILKALDFPSDPWLRFMQWTHRTYPYGPSFLILTLIPSFLSFGKFVLSFIFFKITFVAFYLFAVLTLNNLNRRWALTFATNPLVIVEGIINAHNDLIGVSLALIGIYYILNKKSFISSLFFLMSIGIKYITVPILFMIRSYTKWHKLAFLLLLGILVYLSIGSEIQPWYFLSLFIFLPFYYELINRLNIFFFGLLISYYPYIRLGGWDSTDKINLKHWIIIIFFGINILYLVYRFKINEKNL